MLTAMLVGTDMQRARFVVGVMVSWIIAACTPSQRARPSTTPSTSVRDPGVADDDDSEPLPGVIGAGGNQKIRSFAEAKRNLVPIYSAHRVDLYCGCPFDIGGARGGAKLSVDLAACGYVVVNDGARAARIEWEHAVAAASFGRTFSEWTEGDPQRCVDGKGKRYKGRRCAAKSPEFARMEGDLHNLFPVVGEVNGLRGDLPMGILDPPDRTPPHRKSTQAVFRFGDCKSSIEKGVFMPRAEVRGDLARAALYMDEAYPTRRLLDRDHRQLFEKWSADDPPDAWERERNRMIADRQGNANPFITNAVDEQQER